ncbi:Hypothetical_protein [Hexamita inflata]|uniref:Hypothetical_protein n=1 Tax=Hexamita inflata TaxID=28002 RepID=A0AA86QY14_9EUKA|nr:Hypothetical protein HINF_LOCUS55774 [Hexamita inflata]
MTSSQQLLQFGFIGYTNANTSLNQVNIRTVINASILYYSGILFGHLNAVNNVQIQNVSIVDSNISSQNSQCIGGFIGSSLYSAVKITSSQIQQVHITAQNYIGIVLGYSSVANTFTFQNSSSIFNYINNVLQYDCPLFSNAFSIIGC